MKRFFTQSLIFVLPLLLTACQPRSTHNATAGRQPATEQEQQPYAQPIPIDSANKMLNSYLASIQGSDTALHSLSFDADTLIRYLTDTSRGKIKTVRLMLAHRLDYINSGHYGRNAGYDADALTLVIAGCDTSGNYIYNSRNMVYDYCFPCPHNCPGGNDTLTTTAN